MEKKPGPLVEGKLGAGGGGGGHMRAGSNFDLPKQKAAPMYEIWSKRQNKMVGTATSLKSASRVIDRRDNEYGAYDHFKKKIGRDD